MEQEHNHNGHAVAVAEASPPAVVEVDIRNAYNGTEYADLEAYFRALPGVTMVHLDRTRGVAHLGYDPAVTTPEQLGDRLERDGYRCDCYDRPGSRAQAGHPKVGAEHAHAPGTDGRGSHGGGGHDEHAGHGADMVADLLRRFLVSLVLTLPLLAFSPMGALVGLPSMPPLGLSMGLFGFLLATPVVWWGGWPFHSAAWRELRRGEANMKTINSLGIQVS